VALKIRVLIQDCYLLTYIFTAKPADFFKRGIENLPERWEAVANNGGEYIID
jgi:hypothetical protein